MKKFIISAAAFAVTLAGFYAYGQSATTLATRAAAIRDTGVNNVQSQLPDQDNRTGYLVARYDFAEHGGTGNIAIGPVLPDNVIVRGGFAQVVTAILPATATNALTLVAAGDLLAAGTTLGSTGLKNLIPGHPVSTSLIYLGADTNAATNVVVSSIGSPGVTTDAVSRVTLNLTGTTATSGVVFVYLDLLQGQ